MNSSICASGSGAGNYKWRPLSNGEFRILKLHPGQFHRPLSGYVDNVVLGNKRRQYQTVSYACGNVTKRAWIAIGRRVVCIPESAFQALRCIRNKENSLYLWIDVVCIDQDPSNTTEREQQVASMHSIYSGSSWNFIHLGDSDEFTARAFATAELVTTLVSEEARKHGNVRDFLYKRGQFKGSNRSWMPSGLDDEALYHMYNRPWFRRLWVVQEAALAPKSVCFCGKSGISLYPLLLTAAWYSYKDFALAPQYRAAFNKALIMYDMVYEGFADTDPLRLTEIKRHLDFCLVASLHFLAWNPRDYVFAIRGLLIDHDNPRFRELMQPDYHSSVLRVFTKAMMASMLDAESRVSPLRKVDHRNMSEVLGQDVPSWVIHRDSKPDDSPEQTIIAAELSDLFRADHGSPPQIDFRTLGYESTNFRTLHVRGLLLCTISQVGPIFCNSFNSHQIREFIKNSARTVGCLDVTDRNSGFARSLARTLVAGVDSRGQRSQRSMEDGYLSWIAWMSWLPNQVSLGCEYGITVSLYGKAADFNRAMLHACTGRRFFRTQSGLYGLGSRFMQAGDLLVLLYEADLPSILRPARDGQHHHFVGSCYVDGIMDGEAHGWAGEDFQSQDFFLR